jgi:hypothetical protein
MHSLTQIIEHKGKPRLMVLEIQVLVLEEMKWLMASQHILYLMKVCDFFK